MTNENHVPLKEIKSSAIKKGITGFVIGVLIVSTVFIGANYFELKFNANMGPPSQKVLFSINKPFNASFAEYVPYLTSLPDEGPNIQYKSDLSDVKNLELVPENARGMLSKNGFVVIPSDVQSFYYGYTKLKEAGTPFFITTDSMLNLFHQLYDMSLRYVEYYSFYNQISEFTLKMLNWANNSYYSETIPYVKDAYMRLTALFGTALKLLGLNTTVENLSSNILSMINAEISMIENKQAGYSPILDIYVDYTQFIVRGHYTRNEIFSRFFKTIMFYVQMAFYLNAPIQLARLDNLSYARMALLMTKRLIQNDTDQAFNNWKIVFDPISFFVGKADDLTFYDLQKIIETISISDIENNSTLQSLIPILIAIRPPQIGGTSIPSSLTNDSNQPIVSFRIISQAFTPDSFILQNLVDPKVPNRYMPSGLDVMAVFNSSRAMLHQQHDAEIYENYTVQLETLREFIASWNETTWTQNIYYLWLYSLLPLLNQKGKEYASFMRNQAWADKELITALASWAELRHDTILYAKQSSTLRAGIPIVRGYVEPNPELFARLQSVALMLTSGLLRRGMLDQNSNIIIALEKFSALARNLTIIAEKELFEEKLSNDEIELIYNFDNAIAEILHYCFADQNISNSTDQKVSIIADVHTDLTSNKVLEVGVGYLYKIYVIVPDEAGSPYVSVGYVLTYHEFSWDMNNRLTDEEWQQLLASNNAPPLPEWVTSYIYKKEN